MFYYYYYYYYRQNFCYLGTQTQKTQKETAFRLKMKILRGRIDQVISPNEMRAYKGFTDGMASRVGRKMVRWTGVWGPGAALCIGAYMYLQHGNHKEKIASRD